jgi:hypothetical protein
VLSSFNDLSSTLIFTLEQEENNKISLLDITVFETEGRIETKIYRKPTTTDSIIPADSCHTKE